MLAALQAPMPCLALGSLSRCLHPEIPAVFGRWNDGAGVCWASVWSVWVLNFTPAAAVRLMLCRDPQGMSAHSKERECSSVPAKSCQNSQIKQDKWVLRHPGLAGLGQDCWLSCGFLMLGSPNLTGGKLHQRLQVSFRPNLESLEHHYLLKAIS